MAIKGQKQTNYEFDFVNLILEEYKKCGSIKTLYAVSCDDTPTTTKYGCRDCSYCTQSNCYTYLKVRSGDYRLSLADALESCIDVQCQAFTTTSNPCCDRTAFAQYGGATTSLGYKKTTCTKTN